MQVTEMQMEVLLELARTAREQAYAPYSEYRVGSALLTRDGRMFFGCNVENLSFGLTVCAERNAIAAAVASGMLVGQLMAIVVLGDMDTPISPCGACRQVIAEFAHEGCLVRGVNLRNQSREWRITDLLPDAFSAQL